MSKSLGVPERLNRRPLAAVLAGLLGLAAPTVWATTQTVSNCSDSGTGSLRAAVAAAASGDTVDATSLSCSTITLTSGEIVIAQDSLQILGPSADALTVTTTGQNRILTHTGTQALYLDQLTIGGANLQSTGNALGGCVYSKGNVYVRHAKVKDCSASNIAGSSTKSYARGGAIYTQKTVALSNSTVSGNSVSGLDGAAGGGVFGGTVTASYSTVSANDARSSAGYANGGGIFSGPGGEVSRSTVYGNSAGTDGGGLFLNAGGVFENIGGNASVLESTVSGNTAGNAAGGIWVYADNIAIYNSTIAFNQATSGSISNYAGGLVLRFPFPGNWNVPGIVSNVISNNSVGTPAIEADVSTTCCGIVTVSGSNNLVLATSTTFSSPVISACPLLGLLRDNGGPTWTHALYSTSPAIDTGSNPMNFSVDQRGHGPDSGPLHPYRRASSPFGVAPAVPDIGAYEVQWDDAVFNGGFEGCP